MKDLQIVWFLWAIFVIIFYDQQQIFLAYKKLQIIVTILISIPFDVRSTRIFLVIDNHYQMVVQTFDICLIFMNVIVDNLKIKMWNTK